MEESIGEEGNPNSRKQEEETPEIPNPASSSAFSNIPNRPPSEYITLLSFYSLLLIYYHSFIHNPLFSFLSFCRAVLHKYSPLDWSLFFDKEVDVSIPNSQNVPILIPSMHSSLCCSILFKVHFSTHSVFKIKKIYLN